MLGAVASGPEYPATSLRRVAFRGSACCVEITTVWIFELNFQSRKTKYAILAYAVLVRHREDKSPLLVTTLHVELIIAAICIVGLTE